MKRTQFWGNKNVDETARYLKHKKIGHNRDDPNIHTKSPLYAANANDTYLAHSCRPPSLSSFPDKLSSPTQ